MSSFKDHFSQQSDLYLKYRPLYPSELYDYLASLKPEHDLAWDCGTGNGQAAIGLAAFYEKVIATDPSAQQIGNCLPHDNVGYLVEKAENSSLESKSVDIITIANALHWLDFDLFYKEVRRVLKPNGILAAWAYGLPVISPEVDEVIYQFHYDILGNYWLPENRLVEKEYTTIPFPFEEITSPEFSYEKDITLENLIGYLNTWSATQRYINMNKINPIDGLVEKLSDAWLGNTEKRVKWRLILKVGRL